MTISLTSRSLRILFGGVAVLSALSLSRGVAAQEFAYCDLAVPAQNTKLQLNNATVVSTGGRKGQGIVVTTETTNQRSTVFHTVPIDFVAGESLYQHFRVRISGTGLNGPPNGADGFAFMVQNSPAGDPLGEGKTGAGVTAIGRSGEGFAYAGITRSWALELDTFQNAGRLDPNGNHISFDFGGLNRHTTTGTAAGTTLAAAAEGATVAAFQPVTLAGLGHSLESAAASFETRDVWIDYACAAGTCNVKVYMTFNNPLLPGGFSDPTIPATVPTKPTTPILSVNGVSDITQYLGGTSGYAGFSASTGNSIDEHLVTYWVLSKTQFSDSNTNHVEDLCDCRNVPSACGGNIPICDLGTAMGYCRDCHSNTECSAKDASKPICDSVATGGTGACVQCTSSANCSGTTPNCNTGTNTCTSGCTVDTQCGANQWCSNPTGVPFAGVCTGKLPNGTSIPTTANHAPVLSGVCTAPVGTSVCASGVCDTKDNKCGIAVGDGTCTGTPQCRSGVCVKTGTNSGKCEPCVADTFCSGATPACNTTTNQCVPCTATNTTHCTGTTPVCNVGSNACVPCNGNSGSGSSAACPAGAPFCSPTGACTNNCTTDAQCGAGNWCNNVTTAGTCGPKLPNGTPVPGGNCTTQLGSRACTSAVCDPTDDKCGYPEGGGPCTVVTQCRSGVCVGSGPNAAKCEPCAGNGVCTAPTPACSPVTNHCVQCTETNTGACTGAHPYCDDATGNCVGCTSDLGVVSAHPCANTPAPYCSATGTCGTCSTSADCTGATHSGPYCVNGACSPTCTKDTDCGPIKWCDGAGACDPKLSNGSPLPPQAPISGKCTVANGTRACLSGVCDTADDKCGIGNGTVPPDDAGSPVCRSGVLGSDGKCGYPDGEGPCTTTNGADVCRSGVCNPATSVCGAGDGGSPIHDAGTAPDGSVHDAAAPPTGKDAAPPHVDSGTCASGVRGSDGKCGLPNGEGPCTAENAATVCRSQACNPADGKCGYPAGSGTCLGGATVCRSGFCDAQGVCGCSADGECGDAVSGRACNAATHDCVDGCRGLGGNGCPAGVTCSSSTAELGACGSAKPLDDSLAGGGCACSVPGKKQSAPLPALLGLGAALALALARRRR